MSESLTLEVTDSGPVWYAEEKRWLRRGAQITVPQSEYKRWAGVCKKLISGTIPEASRPFATRPVAPTPSFVERVVEKVTGAVEAVVEAVAGKKEASASNLFACPHCPREFTKEHGLKIHMRNAHPDAAPAEESAQED